MGDNINCSTPAILVLNSLRNKSELVRKTF